MRPDRHPIRRRRAAAGLVPALILVLAACGSPGPARTAPPARPGPSTPVTSTPVTSTPVASTAPAGPDRTSTTGGSPSDPGPASDWTTYQASAARLGQAGPAPALDPLVRAWSAPLDGAAVYGQPLLYDGRVIVATEDDDVYALDPASGAVIWQVNLGAPLRGVPGWAGCGNVDPLGVTSTPVVDPSTGTVYVVGETSTAGRPPVRFRLAGIDVATGRVTSSRDSTPALPAGQDPLHLLQRAALALGDGRVYVGFGGQYGDCGVYSGWVVGVPTDAASPSRSFDVTPAASGGAVWMGGAGPAIDQAGSVYVTTGNPNSSGPAPWAEAALKLTPQLSSPPVAVFQDRAATGDLDLSSGDPVLLPDGTVFVVGKTDIGYLLRQADLGPVATVTGRVCGSDPDGGAAFDPATDSVYVPCQGGGIQQVDLARRATGWRAGQVNSTTVLAAGNLWAVGYPGGTIQELDPVTGRVAQEVATGRSVPHFASLSVAGGLVLVPTMAGVVAFRGPPPRSAP